VIGLRRNCFVSRTSRPLSVTPSLRLSTGFPSIEKWTLTVSGGVEKPGDYTLAQIQSLPKITQNTRHVCIEGWDVIGRFGGVRLSLEEGSGLFIRVAVACDGSDSGMREE